MTELTAEILKGRLHYDPHTGKWTWIHNLSNGRKVAGKEAGGLNQKRYRMVSIDDKLYRSARLAFLYMTGEWPKYQVDHKDGDTTNDRWDNLRAATETENQRNRRTKVGRSGLKGAAWFARRGLWVAAIKISGKRKYLGFYDCPAAAHLSYIVGADKHFGEFAAFSGSKKVVR